MIQILTKENFQSVVLEADKPAFVLFYASYSAPSKAYIPIIQRVAETYGDALITGTVDIPDNLELNLICGIKEVPTVCYYKKGEIVRRMAFRYNNPKSPMPSASSLRRNEATIAFHVKQLLEN